MKKRWWVGLGVIAVGAVVAGLVVWLQPGTEQGRLAASDEGRLSATLTDIQHEDTDTYVYPSWWTDGDTAVRLTAVDDNLVVNEPLARLEPTGDADLNAKMPVTQGTDTATVAALPGAAGAPWVAIAFESIDVEISDVTTTQRPLAWTGTERTSPDTTPQSSSIPVDLRSNESNGAVMVADAAVATIGDSVLAVATTKQLDSGSLHICDVSDCQWSPRELPPGFSIDSIGSTGDGFIAVTDEDEALWYADDAELTWKKIGTAPSGMQLESLQDGAGAATVVWIERQDDAVSIQVGTVSDGQLNLEVDRTPVDGRIGRVTTVTKVEGRWYLGGSRPSSANLALPYDASEGTVWIQDGESWSPLDDELLANQPAQQVEALFVDADGALRAVSSSAVERDTMIWHLARPDSEDFGSVSPNSRHTSAALWSL
jgi:hypothetical protein